MVLLLSRRRGSKRARGRGIARGRRTDVGNGQEPVLLLEVREGAAQGGGRAERRQAGRRRVGHGLSKGAADEASHGARRLEEARAEYD